MTKRKSAARKPEPIAAGSKAEQLKALLCSPAGQTVAALAANLGWQTHSTRAALTRLRHTGQKLEKLDPGDGSRQSRYRLAGGRK